MIEKVLKFADERSMLQDGDRVIVGVSGGADSICLLFTLHAIAPVRNLQLFVVHVEHGIRGKTSLEDAAFVEEQCRLWGIPYRRFSYPVPEIAAKWKKSLEETGRELRYQAFEEACREYNGNKIAVAHHMDDQVETILLNLFRGSGMKGLCGIPAVRGKVIRPLLCVTRAEIETFLREQNIFWRTDETNQSEEFLRNKIRNRLLPYIQREMNPKAIDHIAHSAGQIREAEEFLEGYAGHTLDTCGKKVGGSWRIQLGLFQKESPAIRKRVYRLCMEELSGGLRDITWEHLEAVDKLIFSQSGKQASLPGRFCVRREYGELVMENGSAGRKPSVGKEVCPEIPGVCIFGNNGWRFTFSLKSCTQPQGFPEKMYTKWFDYDKIKNSVLIRTRQTGDYLTIDSAGGHKKLKTYLNQEKIPVSERDQIPLLADGSHIIWVVGHRISEKYKITDDTKRILEVRVEKENGNG